MCSRQRWRRTASVTRFTPRWKNEWPAGLTRYVQAEQGSAKFIGAKTRRSKYELYLAAVYALAISCLNTKVFNLLLIWKFHHKERKTRIIWKPVKLRNVQALNLDWTDRLIHCASLSTSTYWLWPPRLPLLSCACCWGDVTVSTTEYQHINTLDGQIFRIGTVRYAEGLWRMRRHGPVIAHCTESEDFPLDALFTFFECVKSAAACSFSITLVSTFK